MTTTSTPTCCLRRTALPRRDPRPALARDVRALAHVTGGGILGNLSRVLPGRSRGTHRLGRVGASARLRVARRAGRRGRRAPAGVQPRHRHVRRRPGSAGRAHRDRRARVIGVLVSGEGTNLQALIDAGTADRGRRVQPRRRRRARPRRRRWDPESRLRARPLSRPCGPRSRAGRLAPASRGRARRARRLHAPAHARRSSIASPTASSTSTRLCCRSSPARGRSTTRWPRASRRPASPSTTSTKGSTPAR